MNYGTVMSAEKYEDVQRPISKRPGFLARWFLKKLVEGSEWEKRQHQERESAFAVNRLTSSISVGPQSIDQPERAIQFTIYNANGGRVVETRRYDKKTDRSSTGLYVITSDVDFGKEIDKIITMEALKQ